MRQLIFHWVVATLAVLVAAYILPGVSVAGVVAAFVVAVVLGFINMFIKPVVSILTLPVNFITLGLFSLVVNALLVLLVGHIVPGFEVDGFWWALAFGLVVSAVNFVLQNRK